MQPLQQPGIGAPPLVNISEANHDSYVNFPAAYNQNT